MIANLTQVRYNNSTHDATILVTDRKGVQLVEGKYCESGHTFLMLIHPDGRTEKVKYFTLPLVWLELLVAKNVCWEGNPVGKLKILGPKEMLQKRMEQTK